MTKVLLCETDRMKEFFYFFYQIGLSRILWKLKKEGRGWTWKQLDEQNGKNICIMTWYLFYIFIPTVNSNPHCDTSCIGPPPSICDSVSGSLRGQAPKLWGQQKPTRATRARQSGLPVPTAGWNVVDWESSVKSGEQSPGRLSLVGLEPQQTWFCITQPDPGVLQLREEASYLWEF